MLLFFYFFTVWSNSYVGDVFYDELLKAEDGNITPRTSVLSLISDLHLHCFNAVEFCE